MIRLLKYPALAASVLLVGTAVSFATAQWQELPKHPGPRPKTTTGIPHIQTDVQFAPEYSEELLSRVSMLPGVTLTGTIVGRSGSTGFWIGKGIDVKNSRSLIRGREFAHLHPDGSLHASLPPELASIAVDRGWAIHHPWATSKRGLEGFVMIYTPKTKAQLDVVFDLIKESQQHVVGEKEG